MNSQNALMWVALFSLLIPALLYGFFRLLGWEQMPLLCRMGVHTSTYSDGTLLNSAPRCNWCDRWIDIEAGATVELERKLWLQGRSPDEVYAAVGGNYASFVLWKFNLWEA